MKAQLTPSKLGYGGTKEEMERLLADAEKLPAAMGKDFDLNNLGDVYEAIHLIQDDLGLTGVAADEAATTFEGSFNAMKAVAQNLMADLALGNDIRPQLHALAGTVKTFVVGNLLPMIGNIAKQIPVFLGMVPQFIADMAPDFIAGAADIVKNLVTGLIDNIPVFVAGVGTLLQSLWSGITSIDWSAAGQLVVDLLSAAWDGLKTAATAIWETVVGVFTGEIEFPDISEAAKTVWNALTTKASEVWTAVKAWFTKTFTWPNISDAAKKVWNALTTVASEIWNAVKTWFQKTFTFPSLTKLAYDAWNGLTTLASTIWEGIKGWFTSTFSFPSLKAKAKEVWDKLVELAGEIWEGIKQKFRETFSFSNLTAKAQEAWGGLKTRAGSIWTTIKNTFGASNISFSDIAESANEKWKSLKTKAKTVWDGVKTVFSSIEIEWPDFGEMAKGALEGLKTAAKSVWDWVKGLFSGDSDDEAIKSVQGSTSEMAATLADAELQISAVDVSSIQEANEFVKQTVLGWIRIFKNLTLTVPTVGTKSLTAALKTVTDMVSNYKTKMKFSWTLPTLHGFLPVINVSMKEAKSSDGKTSVSYPEFSKSVKWFAEGGVFKNPTIIGIGDSKGPEAAVPLDKMWRQMDREFDRHLSGGNIYQTYNIDGATDPEAFAMTVARSIKRELRMA